MFKKLLFAVVPMLMVATNVFAEDDILADVANLKSDAINDAKISIEAGVGALDFDALAKDAGKDKIGDAIEARSRGGGGGYGSYGYSNYGYGGYYNSYSYYPSYYSYGYSPYSYYRPIAYSYPVYSYPVYSYYWGCY